METFTQKKSQAAQAAQGARKIRWRVYFNGGSTEPANLKNNGKNNEALENKKCGKRMP